MTDFIFPIPQNLTTLKQKILYFDSLTDVGAGGVLGIMILLVVGGALFLIQKAFAVEKAFAVSMFITSVIGILLAIYGIISNSIVYLCLITLVISLYLLKASQDSTSF